MEEKELPSASDEPLRMETEDQADSSVIETNEDAEDDDSMTDLVALKDASPFATSLRSKGFVWIATRSPMVSWSAAGVYVRISPEGEDVIPSFTHPMKNIRPASDLSMS